MVFQDRRDYFPLYSIQKQLLRCCIVLFDVRMVNFRQNLKIDIFDAIAIFRLWRKILLSNTGYVFIDYIINACIMFSH